MEAVIKIGNIQYLIFPNKFFYLNKLKYKINKIIKFKKNILLIKDKNNKIFIGKPYIKNFIIKAIVINHIKSNKIIIFKKKKRKGYKKKIGHRQILTKLKIINIKHI
ncbi:50S ribosomal protein L21 [Candidatus Shikimatogenerans bostrichidophilus]|uniref:50S ribosomal protein L21 n=1 Tax=Candidatus Shikimatogenerans bostrichidophilus TaxID=2943807 RepID=UPI00296653A5